MQNIKNSCWILAGASLLAMVAAMSGCGSETSPKITLSGALTYTDDTPLPAQSNARISMVEHGQDGMNKRIVAERSLYNLGQKPIRFDLDVARDLIDPQGRYGLSAEIVDEGGNRLWVTIRPMRIKPLEQEEPVSLTLKALPQKIESKFRNYRCEDGFHLSTAITNQAALVRLGNRRLELRASDMRDNRYEDDYGNELHVEDPGLTFHVDNGTHRNCGPIADQKPKADTDKPGVANKEKT